jgi:phosphatidylglycerophosphate synthase
MFDRQLRPVIDPHVNRAATWFFERRITANQLTLGALVVALLAMIAIAHGYFFLGLILIAVNRAADGIDGPLSRLYHPPSPDRPGGGTDFGGYLDIVCDFFFYGGIPFAFALFDHIDNALPAAFLLFSFIGSGITFMAFATTAAKRNLTTDAQGQKSFFYLAGLMEGGETIAFFALMCLFAPFFDMLAYIFGALCFISAGSRVLMAYRVLK